MSGTLQASVVKDSASSTNNLAMDASGNVTVGNNLTVNGTSAHTGNATFAGTVGVTGAITGSSTVAGATGILYPLTSGTAQASTSGTAITFTGIPSWVKRVTVMFNGVSTSGSSTVQIQIGSSSGGFETSGYSVQVQNSISASSGITTGFGIENGGGSAWTRGGLATIANVSGNIWVFSSVIGSVGQTITFGGGYKSISSILDRVRITTVNGTDTFTAGSINILYE